MESWSALEGSLKGHLIQPLHGQDTFPQARVKIQVKISFWMMGQRREKLQRSPKTLFQRKEIPEEISTRNE